VTEENAKSVVRSRLAKPMDRLALRFSSSMKDDKNIFYYDILVDIAHTLCLHRMGHIDDGEAKEILLGLLRIRDEGFDGLSDEYEDVHEAIEAKLTSITDSGMKMHTGRSRNDEVATCLRLLARDKLLSLMSSVLELRAILLSLAEKHIDVVCPGFTHLQYAQPTRLSHHLLAYHDMIEREFQRAKDAFRRVNLSPLGSAAFASTSFELDRIFVAEVLGFDGIVENSMDAVSSRDFALESIFVCSSLMQSLSRIAEELILWSSEFGFVELPDDLASSSSIMPQKKNPDIAELIRARAGRVFGNLSSAMMIYKAMPFSYNRDFQEINPLLYFSMESAEICTILISRLLNGVKFKADVLEEKAGKGFTTATEIADMLVQKLKIPFRIAHKIVGSLAMEQKFNPTKEDIVRAAMNVSREVAEKAKQIDEKDLMEVKTPERVVERKKNTGSPRREEVIRMIESRKSLLEVDVEEVENLVERLSASLERLYSEIKKLTGE
jgi:argininosuccinate lyase